MALVRLAISAAALLVAAPAMAQEELGMSTVPLGPKPASWEIAGAVSFLSPPIQGGTNPFGSGFGGRIGTSFGPIYVGGNIADYLGGDDKDLHARSLLWGGEVGYTVGHAFNGGVTLSVRPGVGVGAAMLFYTTPTSTTTTANANPAAHPIVDMVSTASHRTSTPTIPSTTTGTGTGTSTGTTTGTPTSSGGTTGTTATGASTPSETIVTTTNDTTTVTSLYVQPSVTVLLSASWCFAAVKGSATVMPSVADGLGGTATWLTYGLEGQVGLLF